MENVFATNRIGLEASSICSNVVLQLNKNEHYVLYLLGIIGVVILHIHEEFHGGEKFSYQLILFFKYQNQGGKASIHFIKIWQEIDDHFINGLLEWC